MYYRLKLKGFSLAYYAQAPNRDVAIKKVERLSGPLPRGELEIKQVNADQIPEGETIL